MSSSTTRRVLARAAVVALGAVVGMVLLSGSGQPVTAQTHASAASAAEAQGKSLNQWSEEVLAEAARRVVGG